jgi:glycosyltransferase involved in cell wall biosynthesis
MINEKISPLVSVIIPAYNAENFIEITLKSVLNQTYENIEVLVIDDGSQDRTAEIVTRFKQQDERIILLQQLNAGVAAARNLGIAKSKGEYIAPIDADDIWYPQKLEKQIKCLESADKFVGLVYCWSLEIDENDVIIGEYELSFYQTIYITEGSVYPALVYRNFICNASVPLIRRECFDKIGGYNSEFRAKNGQGCEDWDIYLRIAEHYEFRVVPEFLVGYRQVTGSMSRSYMVMANGYEMMMAESQTKHPEVSQYIYNLSASLFYVYLSLKSYSCHDYWQTIIWIIKAIKLDPRRLIGLYLYKLLILCIWGMVTKSFIILAGGNREKINIYRVVLASNHFFNSVEELQKSMTKIQILPEKTNIQVKRWLKIVQSNHDFNLWISR